MKRSIRGLAKSVGVVPSHRPSKTRALPHTAEGPADFSDDSDYRYSVLIVPHVAVFAGVGWSQIPKN